MERTFDDMHPVVNETIAVAYQYYSETKLKIKELTTQLKAMEDELIEDIEKNYGDNVTNDYGTFYTSRRKTWTYSKELTKKSEAVDKKIAALEETIKVAKITEERMDLATFTEAISLNFKAKI